MMCLVSRTGCQSQRYIKGRRKVVGCIPYRLKISSDGTISNEFEVLVISSQKGVFPNVLTFSKSRGTFYEGLMLPIWMKLDEAREACRDCWMKEALDVLVQRLSSPLVKPMEEDKNIPLISIC
ncbi:unnamed protein product [Arabidopsis lyrata]|uniref:Predicted protein n=1 Tax=Arabidopsis lyrata subsp. lyrata TaxID=81972 RepID=D7KHD7_ARALL|nr:predicted protein [Arabidopsis lyrata subsp. lyrata]CAH8252843.1 unnamed protein product [Arabidopsis lyrata]